MIASTTTKTSPASAFPRRHYLLPSFRRMMRRARDKQASPKDWEQWC
jgi:hypothetical protein